MQLDESQKEKIKQHLNQSGLRACPICGAREIALGQIVVAPAYANGSFVIGGPAIPMVQVSCGRCGYMMHFAAKAVGVI